LFQSLKQSLPSQLILIVAISGLVYLLVFTLPFLLPVYYDTIPPVDYSKLTGYSASGFIVYLGSLAALFGLYIYALKLLKPDRFWQLSSIYVVGGGLILAATLIFSYPLTAIDLFIYALRTRGWGLYGLQPLATSPDDLPGSDPWLGLAGEWIDAASPYGPLWELFSLALFHLSGNSYLVHLLWLKVVGGLAYLGTTALVYQTLRTLRPAWALVGTAAVAWNPLVLLESVQNAHNDIVMVFFLMAAIWVMLAFSRQVRWDILVCVFLAFSILIKFVTILVVPFFLISLATRQSGWRRRVGNLLLCSAVIIALTGLVMWTFWPGWEVWAVPAANAQAGRSLLALLVLALRPWLGTNTGFDVARIMIFGVFAGIYLIQLWHTFHPGQNRCRRLQPVEASFYVLFWYVVLAAPVFHAWYLLWFIPLAPLLLPRLRPLQAMVTFSITALLVIPYFETVRVWYPVLLTNHLAGHLVGVPLLILPPIVVLLWPISPKKISKVSSQQI
jgi:hypothetical protein